MKVTVLNQKSIFLMFLVTMAAFLAPSGWAAEAPDSHRVGGQIESVTPTNFSIKTRVHARRAGRLTGIVVHYNPETVRMTVDGVVKQTIDYQQTGKYAIVSGTIVNGVLEATDITITSAPPAKRSKSKSSS